MNYPICEKEGNPKISDKYKKLFKKYQEDGYCVFNHPVENIVELSDEIKKNFFKQEELNYWRENLAESRVGLRLQDSQFPAIKKIASNKEIIEMLSEFYGKKAFPFQTLLFPVGTQQHFHSDSVHFSSIPERFMCGVWVALEDISLDQGPLEYYPRSHRLPIIKNEDINYIVTEENKGSTTQEIYEKYWKEIVRKNKLEKNFFEANIGDSLIWAANLLHGGSTQNNVNLTRWSLVTHYYFEDCEYYTPMLSNEKKGEFHMRDVSNIYR